MTARLRERVKALQRPVGEILHHVWDPIGVAGFPQARDEYDSYVAQVVGRLAQGADEGTIIEFLSEIGRQRMGLEPAAERVQMAAAALIRYRDWIEEQIS